MPRIEKIEPPRRSNLRKILLENGEQIDLRLETVMKFGLRVGDNPTDAKWQSAVAESAEIECRDAAWRSLAHCPRTRVELSRVLRKKKFPPELIERTVADLTARGFVNDEAVATQVAGERARRREGARVIEMKLRAKGVEKELAAATAREAAPPERERENAIALLKKWNRRSKPEEPAKRRQAAAAFLMRKGYESEVVWETVRKVLRADD